MSHDEAQSHGQVSKSSHYEKLENPSHHHQPHGEEGEGPWLMSFADMVTLLMCFFILFFTTDKGNIKLQNPDDLLKKLEQLQKILADEQSAESTDTLRARTPSGARGSLDTFKTEMKQLSRELDLVFSVGTPHPGEIELTFLNTRFFRSGEATLTPVAERMLQVVAQKIDRMEKNSTIEVEGHTDADPIRSSQFPSNWELSGARAATVVRLLQSFGMDPARLRASGLAQFKPIAPERDQRGQPIAANKALNRRVIIRVKQQESTGGPVKKPPVQESKGAP